MLLGRHALEEVAGRKRTILVSTAQGAAKQKPWCAYAATRETAWFRKPRLGSVAGWEVPGSVQRSRRHRLQPIVPPKARGVRAGHSSSVWPSAAAPKPARCPGPLPRVAGRDPARHARRQSRVSQPERPPPPAGHRPRARETTGREVSGGRHARFGRHGRPAQVHRRGSPASALARPRPRRRGARAHTVRQA